MHASAISSTTWSTRPAVRLVAAVGVVGTAYLLWRFGPFQDVYSDGLYRTSSREIVSLLSRLFWRLGVGFTALTAVWKLACHTGAQLATAIPDE